MKFIGSNKLIRFVKLSLVDYCLEQKTQHGNTLQATLGQLKYSEQIIWLEGTGQSLTLKYQTDQTWSEMKKKSSIQKAARSGYYLNIKTATVLSIMFYYVRQHTVISLFVYLRKLKL